MSEGFTSPVEFKLMSHPPRYLDRKKHVRDGSVSGRAVLMSLERNFGGLRMEEPLLVVALAEQGCCLALTSCHFLMMCRGTCCPPEFML